MDSTTHWSPYFFAALPTTDGSAIAPEFTLTLSAPHFRTRSKSEMSFIPPPTVKGMNTCDATAVSVSAKSFLPSCDAVMS